MAKNYSKIIYILHLSANQHILRQFSFTLLHGILDTKKGCLKRFKISESEDFFFCKSPDSLEHAYFFTK